MPPSPTTFPDDRRGSRGRFPSIPPRGGPSALPGVDGQDHGGHGGGEDAAPLATDVARLGHPGAAGVSFLHLVLHEELAEGVVPGLPVFAPAAEEGFRGVVPPREILIRAELDLPPVGPL